MLRDRTLEEDAVREVKTGDPGGENVVGERFGIGNRVRAAHPAPREHIARPDVSDSASVIEPKADCAVLGNRRFADGDDRRFDADSGLVKGPDDVADADIANRPWSGERVNARFARKADGTSQICAFAASDADTPVASRNAVDKLTCAIGFVFGADTDTEGKRSVRFFCSGRENYRTEQFMLAPNAELLLGRKYLLGRDAEALPYSSEFLRILLHFGKVAHRGNLFFLTRDRIEIRIAEERLAEKIAEAVLEFGWLVGAPGARSEFAIRPRAANRGPVRANLYFEGTEHRPRWSAHPKPSSCGKRRSKDNAADNDACPHTSSILEI